MGFENNEIEYITKGRGFFWSTVIQSILGYERRRGCNKQYLPTLNAMFDLCLSTTMAKYFGSHYHFSLLSKVLDDKKDYCSI